MVFSRTPSSIGTMWLSIVYHRSWPRTPSCSNGETPAGLQMASGIPALASGAAAEAAPAMGPSKTVA